MTSKFRIVYTPSASRQFFEALHYIQTERPSAAKNFRVKAEKVLSRLEVYPESGSLIPEFPGSDYKQVLVTPYRFFYRVEKNVVWVVGVWHDAQLPRI